MSISPRETRRLAAARVACMKSRHEPADTHRAASEGQIVAPAAQFASRPRIAASISVSLARTLCRRQRALQKRTCSQQRDHFLRQVITRPQRAQSLAGRVSRGQHMVGVQSRCVRFGPVLSSQQSFRKPWPCGCEWPSKITGLQKHLAFQVIACRVLATTRTPRYRRQRQQPRRTSQGDRSCAACARDPVECRKAGAKVRAAMARVQLGDRKSLPGCTATRAGPKRWLRRLPTRG